MKVRGYARKSLPEIRKCSRCEKDFQPYKKNHIYCSPTCRLGRWKDPNYQRNWYLANREKQIKSNRNAQLKRDYGIDLTEFNRLKEVQNFQCALCDVKYDRLVVDHCHKTGKIRAILCDLCNTGIGKLKENPELLRKAADYIEYHSQKD